MVILEHVRTRMTFVDGIHGPVDQLTRAMMNEPWAAEGRTYVSAREAAYWLSRLLPPHSPIVGRAAVARQRRTVVGPFGWIRIPDTAPSNVNVDVWHGTRVEVPRGRLVVVRFFDADGLRTTWEWRGGTATFDVGPRGCNPKTV